MTADAVTTPGGLLLPLAVLVPFLGMIAGLVLGGRSAQRVAMVTIAERPLRRKSRRIHRSSRPPVNTGKANAMARFMKTYAETSDQKIACGLPMFTAVIWSSPTGVSMGHS